MSTTMTRMLARIRHNSDNYTLTSAKRVNLMGRKSLRISSRRMVLWGADQSRGLTKATKAQRSDSLNSLMHWCSEQFLVSNKSGADLVFFSNVQLPRKAQRSHKEKKEHLGSKENWSFDSKVSQKLNRPKQANITKVTPRPCSATVTLCLRTISSSHKKRLNPSSFLFVGQESKRCCTK